MPSGWPRPTWLDAVLLGGFGLLLVWLVTAAAAGFTYNWRWEQLPAYLVRVDSETGAWQANYLLQGLMGTLRLAFWGILLASILGLVMGLAGLSPRPSLRILARAYVGLVRNTPPLVFIFIFYFFISSQVMPLLGLADWVRAAEPEDLRLVAWLFGNPALLENFASGLLCLVIFEGAYVTEIVRAGIEAVPRGQWEAGRALGLNGPLLLRKVVLPQAARTIAPPLAGQLISLVKDSAIVSLISVQELTFAATEVAVSSGLVYETWIAVAGMYFAICMGLSLLLRRLEQKPG